MIHPRMSLHDVRNCSEMAQVAWVLKRLPVGELVTAAELSAVYGFHPTMAGRVLKSSTAVREVGRMERTTPGGHAYTIPRYEVVG